MKRYYSLVQNGTEADIYIYGDITSWDWFESDVSSYTLSKTLESLDADTINVYINSYGGEVAEGLAIYNALKRHKAKIKTFADGFACSIASVIFMAGDERIMSSASLLMIHNAWTYTAGNAAELRKQADDLDVITQASINAYMAAVNIPEEEVKQLLDSESWLSPQLALEKGFATSVINETTSDKISASARGTFFAQLFKQDQKPKDLSVDVRITDLPEFQQAIADLRAEFAAQQNPGTPPADPEPLTENKTMKFLNALMGGKE